jgi:hypothetical protein
MAAAVNPATMKERKQTTMPHQKLPSTEDKQKEEESASILRMATTAARARANQPKQESDIFTKKIEAGLKDLKAKKRQLEKSLGTQVQEAKDRMIETQPQNDDNDTQ